MSCLKLNLWENSIDSIKNVSLWIFWIIWVLQYGTFSLVHNCSSCKISGPNYTISKNESKNHNGLGHHPTGWYTSLNSNAGVQGSVLPQGVVWVKVSQLLQESRQPKPYHIPYPLPPFVTGQIIMKSQFIGVDSLIM